MSKTNEEKLIKKIKKALDENSRIKINNQKLVIKYPINSSINEQDKMVMSYVSMKLSNRIRDMGNENIFIIDLPTNLEKDIIKSISRKEIVNMFNDVNKLAKMFVNVYLKKFLSEFEVNVYVSIVRVTSDVPDDELIDCVDSAMQLLMKDINRYQYININKTGLYAGEVTFILPMTIIEYLIETYYNRNNQSELDKYRN